MEGFLYQRLNFNPSTLDPAYIVDVTGGTISAKLFNGLVRLNDRFEVVPDIAEYWSVSNDGKTYSFHLKRNVMFHNGRKVRAADVKYSFERVLAPSSASPNTWVFDRILGAEEFMAGKATDVSGIIIKDTFTLIILLKEAFPQFPYLLSMAPAYIVPKEDVVKWGKDFATHPTGTGPFRLVEWRHNLFVRVQRNTDYFDGLAKLKGIIYRIIPEDITASAEFEVGNLDTLSIPASEYRRYRRSDKWSSLISTLAGLNTYYLGLNCSKPPFDNAMARNAVAYAIDREKILNTFYEGRGRIADGPVPDTLRKWNIPEMRKYDPSISAHLVRQTGLYSKVLNFYVSTDPENVDIAEIVQSYLKKAGISVKIRQLEWSAYKTAINNGEADMFWLSWWADYPNAENFLFPLFHSSNHGAGGNRTRYTNKVVDAYIDKARQSVSPEEGERALAVAEKLIIEESPWIFFWHKNDYIVRQPWLKNFKIYPIYSMDKGMEISF